MLTFILADSALELVPRELWRSPAVVNDARRRGVEPSSMLLDRSFHHVAMKRLKESEKRGRPDIVHQTLLSVTGTPLYLDGKVRVYLHMAGGTVMEVAERTRVPKHFIRFRGLMEQALAEGGAGELVRVKKSGFRELIRETSSERVFGLSVRGDNSNPVELASRVEKAKDPAVVVGGFPHGHFSKEVMEYVDEVVRIDEMPLEAHVVAARVVYEIEKRERGFND